MFTVYSIPDQYRVSTDYRNRYRDWKSWNAASLFDILNLIYFVLWDICCYTLSFVSFQYEVDNQTVPPTALEKCNITYRPPLKVVVQRFVQQRPFTALFRAHQCNVNRVVCSFKTVAPCGNSHLVRRHGAHTGWKTHTLSTKISAEFLSHTKPLPP